MYGSEDEAAAHLLEGVRVLWVSGLITSSEVSSHGENAVVRSTRPAQMGHKMN